MSTWFQNELIKFGQNSLQNEQIFNRNFNPTLNNNNTKVLKWDPSHGKRIIIFEEKSWVRVGESNRDSWLWLKARLVAFAHNVTLLLSFTTRYVT